MNNIEKDLKDDIGHTLFEFFNSYASITKTLNSFDKYGMLAKFGIFNQRDTIKKILIKQRSFWKKLEKKNIKENSFYNEIITNTTNEICKLSTK